MPTCTVFPSFVDRTLHLIGLHDPEQGLRLPVREPEPDLDLPLGPTRNSACTVFASLSKTTCSLPDLSPFSSTAPSHGNAGVDQQTTPPTKSAKFLMGCFPGCGRQSASSSRGSTAPCIGREDGEHEHESYRRGPMRHEITREGGGEGRGGRSCYCMAAPKAIEVEADALPEQLQLSQGPRSGIDYSHDLQGTKRRTLSGESSPTRVTSRPDGKITACTSFISRPVSAYLAPVRHTDATCSGRGDRRRVTMSEPVGSKPGVADSGW